jgi:prepilin-type processing-associated H-X9-DG protein
MEMPVFAMARHGRGVNVLYFDGSARNTRAKELWTLPWHRKFDVNYAAGNIGFPDWMN